MKKLNLYGQIASVLSALAILAGCSGQENTDDGFAEYVEAYTGGLVTGSSDIVVELTSPAVGISGSDSDIRKATKVNLQRAEILFSFVFSGSRF